MIYQGGRNRLWYLEPVWAFWRRENPLSSARSRKPDRSGRSLVNISTELSRLLFNIFRLYRPQGFYFLFQPEHRSGPSG
jgi:hypothetical protein